MNGKYKLFDFLFKFPEYSVDADEKPRGVMLDWKDLYFPIGCGMAKGGVLLDAPVFRAPGGSFQQVRTIIRCITYANEIIRSDIS